MKMKKLIASALALSMAAGLAGCGSAASSGSAASAAPAASAAAAGASPGMRSPSIKSWSSGDLNTDREKLTELIDYFHRTGICTLFARYPEES